LWWQSEGELFGLRQFLLRGDAAQGRVSARDCKSRSGNSCLLLTRQRFTKRIVGDKLLLVQSLTEFACMVFCCQVNSEVLDAGMTDWSGSTSEITVNAVVTSMPSMRARFTPQVLKSWLRRSNFCALRARLRLW
jgi:hypothetical protein